LVSGKCLTALRTEIIVGGLRRFGWHTFTCGPSDLSFDVGSSRPNGASEGADVMEDAG
jgi:hypothetical protein